MGYSCRVLADSVSPAGVRLTTLEVTFPRIVLAEFNTHRMLSRNSASSRAIPVEKRIMAVEADPFVPEVFGRNQKGMVAVNALEGMEARDAERIWREACAESVARARQLSEKGVHKQLANRLLEPFCWHTVIVTATEWSNFFALRCHPNAQPEIQRAAELMRDAMANNTPMPVPHGGWHRPFLHDLNPIVAELLPQPCSLTHEHDRSRHGCLTQELNLISSGRCARVSYLTHDGEINPKKDLELAQRLQADGHMSPFEHVATPLDPVHHRFWSGNFRGWKQHRKYLANEDDFGRRAPCR